MLYNDGQKKCFRCGNTFECSPGSINSCQCSGVTLTEKEKKYIGEQFTDCLCFECLNEHSSAYQQLKISLIKT